MRNFVKNFEDLKPSVNDSPYKRIIAIGDVHASLNRLKNLWAKLDVTENDRVIFLGYYVEGYEDSDFETLQWLMNVGKNKNVVILRGNANDAFRLYYQRRGQYEKFCNFIAGIIF